MKSNQNNQSKGGNPSNVNHSSGGIKITDEFIIAQIENKIRLFIQAENPSNHFPELSVIHSQLVIEMKSKYEIEKSNARKERIGQFAKKIFKSSQMGAALAAIFVLSFVVFPEIISNQKIPVIIEQASLPATKALASLSADEMNYTSEILVEPMIHAKPIASVSMDEVPDYKLITKDFKPFGIKFENKVATFTWIDKNDVPATYMVQKSNDGGNFEIVSVVDASPSQNENTFFLKASENAPFFRLVKIIHGGDIYQSKVLTNTTFDMGYITFEENELFTMEKEG